MEMRRTIFLFYLCIFGSLLAAGQAYKSQIDSALLPTVSGNHYQPEYLLDAPSDLAAWTRESPGMHVAFGSSDQLYFRSDVPAIDQKNNSWQGVGWKGERLNAQLIMWSADTLHQVRLTVSDLVNE